MATTIEDVAPVWREVDFGSRTLNNTFQAMDALRDAGEEVVPVRFHDGAAWLIVGADAVEQAFMNEEEMPGANFYEQGAIPFFGRPVVMFKGAEHRLHRGLFGAPLMPAKIRERISKVLAPVSNRLIDDFGDARQVDFVKRYSELYPFRVITALLGLPADDDDHIRHHVERLFLYPYDPEGAMESRNAMIEYLQPFLSERRERPGDDLISILAHAEVQGKRYTDEELLDAVRFLYPAAGENTAHGLALLIWRVLSDPAVAERVRADPADRAAAVEETLRVDPPVATIFRYVTEPVTIRGVTIPANNYVLLSIASANRDPKRFDDPTRFSLDRGMINGITFGRGPHFCLGAHLARAELRTTLDNVLDRLPGVRLASDDIRIEGAVQRGPVALPIAFDDILPAR